MKKEIDVENKRKTITLRITRDTRTKLQSIAHNLSIADGGTVSLNETIIRLIDDRAEAQANII